MASRLDPAMACRSVASAVTPLLPLSPALQGNLQHALVACFVILLGWLVLVAANAAADSYLDRLKLDVSDNLVARKAVTQDVMQ